MVPFKLSASSPSLLPISSIPIIISEPATTSNTTSLRDIFMMYGPAAAIVFCGVLLSSACVFMMSARFYIRYKNKVLGLDDFSMGLGVFFFMVSNGLAMKAATVGIGRQDWEIDFLRPLLGAEWVILWGFAFAILTIPVKLSVLITILRLVKTRLQKKAIYFLMVLTPAAAFFQIVWILRACRPFSYLWDSVNQTGSCDNIDRTVASIYAFAGMSMFIDAAAVLLPIATLRGTQMPLKAKLLACFYLSLGLVATVATIARMFYIPAYQDMGSWAPGFYMKLAGVIITSQFEIGFAILAGSFGVWKQFQERLARRKLGQQRSETSRRPSIRYGITNTISGGTAKKGYFGRLKRHIDIARSGESCDIRVETTLEQTVTFDLSADALRSGRDFLRNPGAAVPSSRLSIFLSDDLPLPEPVVRATDSRWVARPSQTSLASGPTDPFDDAYELQELTPAVTRESVQRGPRFVAGAYERGDDELVEPREFV